MNCQLRFAAGLLTVLLLLSSDAAHGQQTPLAPIADYLEPETLLVGRVDLADVRPRELFGWIQKQFGPPPPPEVGMERFDQMRKIFASNGGKQAFVLWSLADALAGDEPAVFIPLNGVDGSKRAIQSLKAIGGPENDLNVLGKCVLIAQPKVRDRLAAKPRAQRPRLLAAAAAAAAGKQKHWVVASLPPTMRKPLIESMPDLPAELGGAKGKQLAEALDWLLVGIDLPPQPSIALRIHSPGEESAAALLKTAQAALPRINPRLPQLLPMRQDASAVVLNLNSQQLSAVLQLVTGGPIRLPGGAEANRRRLANQTKQIGLAFHNYHDTYSRFPPFANADDQGKPLLSWRVHILPFLEEQELYSKFRLNEPWDSEHNRKLIPEMPQVYMSPPGAKNPAGKTVFQTPIMPGSLLGDAEVPRFRDITDGNSNTVMIVLTRPDRAVVWTRPADYKVDPKQPAAGLGADAKKQVTLGFCDGSVRFFPIDISGKLWLAYFTKNGGEVVEPIER